MSVLERCPLVFAVTGALSRGFCCVQVNSVLKSLPRTLTSIENAPAEERYQMKFSRESKP